jgi:hypothetical protein
MPFTTFVAGDVLTAARLNTDLRNQVVTPFASTSALASAITAPVVGMTEYISSNDANEGLLTRSSANQWRLPWNMPWGRVGSTVVSTAMTSGTSGSMSDLSGLSVTFTAIANRYYKMSMMISNLNSSVAQTINVIFANASSAQLANCANVYLAAGTTTGVSGYMLTSPSAGSFTIKAMASASSATAATTGATWTNWLIVEDVGPNGAPA